jgi:hypothetical protein
MITDFSKRDAAHAFIPRISAGRTVSVEIIKTAIVTNKTLITARMPCAGPIHLQSQRIPPCSRP